MAHRDDWELIKEELEKSMFEIVYQEIEKRGVNRKKIPPHIHEKLFHCIVYNASVALSLSLQQAISEMTRTGVMKDFP